MALEMANHANAIADKLNAMNDEELREYLRENDLDTEYTVNLWSSDIIVLGVEIWITLGGPTVWISTRDGQVHAKHGGSHGWAYLTPDTAAKIHRIYEEIFLLQHLSRNAPIWSVRRG